MQQSSAPAAETAPGRAGAPTRRGWFAKLAGLPRHWRIFIAAYVIGTVWFSLVALMVYVYLHR